jgi:hypothetical protein
VVAATRKRGRSKAEPRRARWGSLEEALFLCWIALLRPQWYFMENKVVRVPHAPKSIPRSAGLRLGGCNNADLTCTQIPLSPGLRVTLASLAARNDRRWRWDCGNCERAKRGSLIPCARSLQSLPAMTAIARRIAGHVRYAHGPQLQKMPLSVDGSRQLW